MGWLKRIKKKARGLSKKARNFSRTKVGKFIKKKLVKHGLPVVATAVPGGVAAYGAYQAYEKYKGYIPKGKSRGRKRKRSSKRGRVYTPTRHSRSLRRRTRSTSKGYSRPSRGYSSSRSRTVEKPKSRAGFIAGGIGIATTIAALLV